MSYLKQIEIIDTAGDSALVNEDGQLHVVMEGKADVNNSTIIPLGGDEIFTGVATKILEFSAIAILLYSNADSAINGLDVQFSNNATDWHSGEKYTIAADTTKFFTPPCQAQYYRIVYTNGNASQTEFHLHSTLKKSPIKWSSHKIQDGLEDEDDGTLNISVLKLKTAKDTYVSGAATTGGNFKVSLEELEDGISVNENSQLKTTIYDELGNAIDSHESVDGGFHLGTTVLQSLYVDANNSSVLNLAAGVTFTGVSTATSGFSGIKWSLHTDQNCTVTVEQSDDETNWDLCDNIEYYYAKGGTGRTVQIIKSYWRMLVKNNGLTATTEFRLAAILCPVISPLPRTLSNYGNLQVVGSIRGDENTGRHVWVNPTNEMAISPVFRLVGTAFDGLALDPNFWTPTLSDGTITQSGGSIHLNTTTAPSGSASYKSVRKGRFVAGSAMLFAAISNFETEGTIGNVRRIGAYDDQNGYFFQLDGTTFSLGTRKASTDTLINSGSFNGNLGSDWTPVAGSHAKFSIEYLPSMTVWYINDIKLHTEKKAHLSDTQTLPITMENINTTIEVDIEFESDGAYIARQGELETNPTSKRITIAGNYPCKNGAGILKRIVLGNSDKTGTSITLYDGVDAAGSVIGVINYGGKDPSPVSLEYGIPFNDGLFIVGVGEWDSTIVYE